MKEVRVIAVDGPSGAGKSSVSQAVGKRLGFLHVDSGALYRIITWQTTFYISRDRRNVLGRRLGCCCGSRVCKSQSVSRCGRTISKWPCEL